MSSSTLYVCLTCVIDQDAKRALGVVVGFNFTSSLEYGLSHQPSPLLLKSPQAAMMVHDVVCDLAVCHIAGSGLLLTMGACVYFCRQSNLFTGGHGAGDTVDCCSVSPSCRLLLHHFHSFGFTLKQTKQGPFLCPCREPLTFIDSFVCARVWSVCMLV